MNRTLAPRQDAGLKPLAAEDFVLAALLSAGADGATTTDLKKQVGGLAPRAASGGEQSKAVGTALDRLQQRGEAETHKRGRWRLTAAGITAARAAHGLGPADAAPEKWGLFRDVNLVGRVLDIAPNGAAGALLQLPDGLRSLVVARAFDLPIAAALRGGLPAIRQELIWAAFETLRGKPVTGELRQGGLLGNALSLVLLADLLGVEPTGDANDVMRRLVAKLAGVIKTDTGSVRMALLRRAWALADQSSVPAPTGDQASRTDAPAIEPPPMALEDFAAGALAAARACPSGWFGDDCVFINHVWRHVQGTPLCHGLTLASFKQKLVEAHKAWLLTLSKADLVSVLDPADVADSLTLERAGDSDLAGWHFIRLPAGQ